MLSDFILQKEPETGSLGWKTPVTALIGHAPPRGQSSSKPDSAPTRVAVQRQGFDLRVGLSRLLF